MSTSWGATAAVTTITLTSTPPLGMCKCGPVRSEHACKEGLLGNSSLPPPDRQIIRLCYAPACQNLLQNMPISDNSWQQCEIMFQRTKLDKFITENLDVLSKIMKNAYSSNHILCDKKNAPHNVYMHYLDHGFHYICFRTPYKKMRDQRKAQIDRQIEQG